MMVGKMGDIVGKGGIVFTGAFSVLVNDRPAARIGSLITPHDSDPVHRPWMLTGFPGVLVEDLPISRLGDLATCFDVLITISDVEAG